MILLRKQQKKKGAFCILKTVLNDVFLCVHCAALAHYVIQKQRGITRRSATVGVAPSTIGESMAHLDAVTKDDRRLLVLRPRAIR